MHFSYLPDELIAHIASCLNYSDVYNLMQTSNKNYNAIKRYKMDKIRLQKLQFGYSLSGKFTLEAIDSSGKKYSYKNWDETKVDANEVEKVLSKCASIDILSVHLPNLFEIEFFNIIMDAKTCIRTIEIHYERTNISVCKLLRLCQKSIVHFFFEDDVDNAMLNDEVLLKIFPGSIRKSCTRIVGNVVSPMPITNRILQSLIGKTELPKEFCLNHVHNFITVNEVVKTINILHERCIDSVIYWCLGILQPYQRGISSTGNNNMGYGNRLSYSLSTTRAILIQVKSQQQRIDRRSCFEMALYKKLSHLEQQKSRHLIICIMLSY